MKRPSMQTVADASGYSKSAVCLALRNDPSIPEGTRRAIRKVADDLGYTVDPVLSAMASRRWAKSEASYRQTLAYVTHYPEKERIDYRAVLNAVRTNGLAHGYALEEFFLRDYRDGRQLEEVMQARGVHGVFVGPVLGDPSLMNFDWTRLCPVCLGIGLHDLRLNTVKLDTFAAYRMLLDQLVSRGRKRIGVVLRKAQFSDHDARKLGALLAYSFLSTRENVALIPLFREDDAWATQVAQLTNWARENRLDAVIAESDSVYFQLREGGVRIPADIAVVTQRDPRNAEPISGFRVNPDTFAAAGVQLMDQLLRFHRYGRAEAPVIVIVQPEWIEGETH